MVVEKLDYNYDLSRMGEVKISYDRLLTLLGPPVDTNQDDKITMFWAFRIEDFSFAIHNYGQVNSNPRDIKTWSVGSYRSNKKTSSEMKKIYIGSLLSGEKIIERGMIHAAFNLKKLENYPPYMDVLYVE